MSAVDARYRAVFTDLRTDQAIDVLPLQGVEYDDYLGKPGSLSATLPVPDARMARRVRELVEGRTAVYLERGDEVCWGGIVWTLTRPPTTGAARRSGFRRPPSTRTRAAATSART
ncbi:hypothetical protein SAZ11_54195 [Streptomyces sp. FXJ1.4098]|nr:hypothetical protein [Streptomyces sp. FXJ1.4098]